MLKLTAIVSLLLIATWSHADPRRFKKEATASGDFVPGSTLWAASLSCDSCGSECASACGTRHFRSCCFNYLRRKRGPDGLKFQPQTLHEKQDAISKSKPPLYIVENVPETWMPNDFKPYPLDDMYENRMQVFYDV